MNFKYPFFFFCTALIATEESVVLNSNFSNSQFLNHDVYRTFSSVADYNQICNQLMSQWENKIYSDFIYLDVNELNTHPYANQLTPGPVEDFDAFKKSPAFPEYLQKAAQMILNGELVKEFFFSFSELDGRTIDLTDKPSIFHDFTHTPSVLPISIISRQLLKYRLQLEKLASNHKKDPLKCLKHAKIIMHINEINYEQILADLDDFNWYGFSPDHILLLVQPSFGGYRVERGKFVPDETIQRRSGHGFAFMQVAHPDLGKSYTFTPEGKLLPLNGSALDYLKDKGAAWILTSPVSDLSQLTDSSLQEEKLAIALSLADKNHHVIIELIENPEKTSGSYWVRSGTNTPFPVHSMELLSTVPGLQRPLDRIIGEGALYCRFCNFIQIDACKKLLAENGLPLYIKADDTSSTYRFISFSDDISRLKGAHPAAFHIPNTKASLYRSIDDSLAASRFMALQDADPEFKALVKEVFLDRARKHLAEPLRFQPNWVSTLWGGSRIAKLKNNLSYPIGNIGETWEISAQNKNPSLWIYQNNIQPITLEDMMKDSEIARKIIGDRVYGITKNWFPILYKFLDARQPLSVQVHPSTQVSYKLGESEPGKSETWVVIDAKPGAAVYIGFKESVTREMVMQALERGDDLLPMMQRYSVKPGDCLRNCPGVVHSIGAGVFVAEIQGNSDVTYRLFDHHRTPPRPLHVPQALQALDIELSKSLKPEREPRVEQYSLHGSKVELLAQDSYYEVRRADLNCYDHLSINGQGDFQIVSLISGRAHLCARQSKISLSQGETVLIPGALSSIVLATQGKHAQVLIIKPGTEPYPAPKVKEFEFINSSNPTGRIHLGASIGGTKILLGAMSAEGFVHVGDRIEWKKILESQNRYNAEGFLELLVDELADMVQILCSKGVDLTQIDTLGIAWPGPGNYEVGRVSATFLPGFDDYPLASRLSKNLEKRLSLNVKVEVLLDAWADALGEMSQNETLKNWTYLNVATGVAVGIVKDGKILDAYQWPNGLQVNSGLGQIGRHVIRLPNGKWEYRPTKNGQIPSMKEDEIRLTDWVGGPGLAKRWLRQVLQNGESMEISPDHFFGCSVALLEKQVGERNANAVQRVLETVHIQAAKKNELALEMVADLGRNIGSVLRLLADAFPKEFFYNRIIVGGGVIEHLGTNIAAEKSNRDILLDAMIRSSQIPNIQRTQMDVRRELLAFKPPLTFANAEVLVFDLDGTLYHSPELLQRYREALYELYATAEKVPLDTALDIVESARKELIASGMPSGDRNVVEALGFSYQEMLNAQEKTIRDPCCYVQPLPGLAEHLRELKKRYRMVLATNNAKKPALAILKTLGMSDVFEKIYPQDVTELHKPDPRLFELIQSDMGTSFQQMVSIGDRLEADINPAKALGMQVLHVRNPEDLLKKMRELLSVE